MSQFNTHKYFKAASPTDNRFGSREATSDKSVASRRFVPPVKLNSDKYRRLRDRPKHRDFTAFERNDDPVSLWGVHEQRSSTDGVGASRE